MAQQLEGSPPIYIVLGILVALLYIWSSRQSTKKLPPGPPGKFLAGNTYDIPRKEPWKTYMSWSKIYGPLVSFRIFNRRTIVINSPKAVFDLMESRSNIYADRPFAMMTGELAGRKQTMFHMSFFSPKFKTYRKLLHSALNPRAVKEYESILHQETRTLLNNLLSAPEKFHFHIRRHTSAIIVRLVYGYQVEKEDDPYIMLVSNALNLIGSIAIPGKYLVEFLPYLRFVPAWFPGAGFKRIAREVGRKASQIENAPFQWAKSQIKSGNYLPSFTSKSLLSDNPDADGFSTSEQESIVMWCGEGLYAGGADTVVSGRLPTFDDYSSMPYIKAVIKEINRWSPVAPLGLPHRVSADDHYEGYFIPKGTKIVANIWALTHDEETYPNPSVFDPERHLGDNPQMDPFKFAFGFGRRSCPGSHFAEMSIFLTVSSILATYNIGKPLDKDGKETEPLVEWDHGATLCVSQMLYGIILVSNITPKKDKVTLIVIELQHGKVRYKTNMA
ncbi:cytochrome P450 [Cyathus striatus]|nr:cytochrome P450 [Cyathus striatus]